MPYHLKYDEHLGVMFETWNGDVTVVDVLASIKERRAMPRYGERTPRLIDISRATGSIPSQELHRLATMHGASTYRGVCAIVAVDDYQFGISRMFQGMLGEARELRVFRTRGKALEWLTPGASERLGDG